MKIPPVNDFPLEMFQLPGRLPKTTLLIVGIAALIQDCGTTPHVSIQLLRRLSFFEWSIWKFLNRESRMWDSSSASGAAISAWFVFAHPALASGKLQVS